MPSETPAVEYYFSFVSLWSYVGSLAFQELTARRKLRVVPKPIELMTVFAASGGKPVKERATQRQDYRLIEMQRWREIRGIPLVLHPKYYPADPARGHRMLLAAIEQGQDVTAFIHAGLKAVWADELDIEDPVTLSRLASDAGLDGPTLLARSDEPALHAREKALTAEALARDVFGAPFYFYRDEPFWGQDRIDMLDAVIGSGRAPVTSAP